jgi:putative sigma-54 modulation protein
MEPIINKPLQIQITGRNIELTDAIRDMVNKKFEKLSKHFNHITHIHVTLKVNNVDRSKPKGDKRELKKLQTAKALILLPSKHEIVAEESTTDLYDSIDRLVSTLDRQLIETNRMMKSKNGAY